MLQLKEIALQNFCQHRDRVVAFDPGITGILGGNGRGKSNVIKAIKFAAVGESGNVGNKTDDLNWQAAQEEKPGFVQWTFEQDGVEGVLKRFINTSRATLRFGKTKCNSAGATNSEILKIMGITRRTLEDIVFVMQGEIERILFERPSDRAKKFQGLFGTEHAEKIREILQRELAHVSTDPVDERIEELQRHLKDDVDPQLRVLNDEKTGLEDVLRTIDENAVRRILELDKNAGVAEARRKQLQVEAAAASTATIDMRGRVQITEQSMSGLSEAVHAMAAGIVTKRAKLQNLKSAKQAFDTRQSLLADEQEAQAVVNTADPVAPAVTMEQVDAGFKNVATAQLEVDRMETFIRAFEGAEGTPICPTCQQPVHNPVDMVARYRAELPVKQQTISETVALLSQARGECRAHQIQLNRIQAKREEAAKSLTNIRKHLEQLGEAPLVDEAAANQLTRDIEEHDGMQSELQSLTEELASLREGVARNEARAEELDSQIAELDTQLAGRPSTQDVADADQALHQCEQDRLRVAEIDGQLKQLQVDRARTLAELEGLEEQAGSLKAKRTYRELCDRARTVLHRDHLPQLVTSAYLNALNAKLDEYLRTFGVDFSCYIKDDLSVACYFPGVGEQPAGRLSGGQKVMLGIAFRFAVYNLFASDMGFMVLDEPTNMLDQDHVGHVLEVLAEVGRYAHNIGMQLVVITHEERLLGAFDRVVRL